MSESEALYFRVMQDSFRLIQPVANFLYEESKVNISKAQNLKSGQTAYKRETETERDTQRDRERDTERQREIETHTHTETQRHRDREQCGWGERAVSATLPRTRPSVWPWVRPPSSFSVLGLVCSRLPWGTEDRGTCHSEGIQDHPTHHVPSWRRETG